MMMHDNKSRLGREEMIILGLLSNYGPLQVEQIVRYFTYLGQPTIEKLIERMVYRRLVYRCGSSELETAHEITINPEEKLDCVKNESLQRVFWVIVDFIEHERASGDGHSAAQYPSSAMIIAKNSTIYEIVVVDEGDEAFMSHMITNRFREQTENDELEPVKYITVIKSPAQIPKIKIPNIHVFAIVNNDDGEVKYLKPKN